MKRRCVIISGGGTGGHVYPALVLGQKLLERDSGLHVTFVGSRRKAEQSIMEHYKARYIPMPIEGLKGRGWRSLKSLILLPGAFLKSMALLLRLKPGLVVGVGGYSSGPIVLLASWMKIPTLILEQNVRPGFTNRLLIPWVKKAVTAFESSLPHFKGKGIFLGNPVREKFYSLPPKERKPRLAVLIFGGSQGSHFLNRTVVAALPLLKTTKDRLEIFHQTGKNDFEWVKKNYAENGFDHVTVSPFFFEMPDYFRASDLILSRAGATTCAELVAAQKASLLIPFAKAADNHQALNAAALKSAGGADVIPEGEATPQALSEKIHFFLEHPERLSDMEKNLARLKIGSAANRIADLCFEMMEACR